MGQRGYWKSYSKTNNTCLHYSISSLNHISSTINKINSNSNYSFGSAVNNTSNKYLSLILIDCYIQSEEVMQYTDFTQPRPVCDRTIFHARLPRQDFEIFASNIFHSADRPDHYNK